MEQRRFMHRLPRRRAFYRLARVLLVIALVGASGLLPPNSVPGAHGAPTLQESAAGETGGLTEQAGTLLAQGNTLQRQGDLRGALDRYSEALALYRQAGARIGAGNTLNNLGVVYVRLGQYARALEFYEQALAIWRALGDRGGAGDTLNNLGIVHRLLGQYGQALDFFEQALAIRRALGDRRGEGGTLNNLGTVYRDLGQSAQAVDFYEQALPIWRAVGDREGEGGTLNNLANVHSRLGQSAQALAFYEQALAIQRAIGDRTGEGGTLNNLGLVHADLDQFAQALPLYEESLAIRRALGDRVGEGLTLDNVGQAYAAVGDAHAALAAYQQAIEAREDVRAAARIEEFKTSLAEQEASLYERATWLLLWLGRPAEAFALAERGRARSFLDQLGNARLDPTRAADPRRLAQEQRLRGEIAALDQELRRERARPAAGQNAPLIASLSAQVAAHQRDYEALLTQLKLSDPESASLVSVAPLTLAELQALLDPDTTLVAYLVTRIEVYAFIVRQDAFRTVTLPVSQFGLRAAVNRFRAFADAADAAPALEQLASWLVAPLADELTTPIVAVVPHGILHYLPFGALPHGDGYLGDAYTLHYLPSASTLPFIQQKRKAPGDRVLALAYSRAEGLPPLRFADAEAATIAGLYGSQPLLDRAASKATLRAQVGEASLLHLAAHGELNEARPLFSRIFLAPDGQDDGSLTVQDVYGLNLGSADLVVLSACETQLGAQSKGDEIVGLNRAFIYAGAPSVIASLWSVNDQATAVLMAAFYRHLQAGSSKAQALQRAQTETRAAYPHPYYWAAFVLTGDPGTTPPS